MEWKNEPPRLWKSNRSFRRILPKTKNKCATLKHGEWTVVPISTTKMNFRALSKVRQFFVLRFGTTIYVAKREIHANGRDRECILFLIQWTLGSILRKKMKLCLLWQKENYSFRASIENKRIWLYRLNYEIQNLVSIIQCNRKQANFSADCNRNWILPPMRVTKNILLLSQVFRNEPSCLSMTKEDFYRNEVFGVSGGCLQMLFVCTV